MSAGADVQVLLDGLAAELDAGVVLDDLDFRLLAHTSHGDVVDDIRRAVIMHRKVEPDVHSWFEQWGIRSAMAPVRTPADDSLGVLGRWCIPVRFRGNHFGYVWVIDDGRLDEGAVAPAVAVAEEIGMQLYRRRLLAQAENDLLRVLLTPDSQREPGVAEALAPDVFAHKGPFAVIVVDLLDRDGQRSPSRGDLARAVQRASESGSAPVTLAGIVSDVGVLLTGLRRADDLGASRRLAEDVRRLASHSDGGDELIAAIGGVAELPRVSRSYKEAWGALRMIRAIPDLGPVVAWDDLGVFRALALLSPQDVSTAVIDPRVRNLLGNPELVLTAETFLDLAGNVQATAQKLHLHRTTLYQRLDKIDSAYKLDLRRSGEHRLVTHLGLKLARAAAPA